MSNINKRLELYKRLGLKTTIVAKTGSRAIFSNSPKALKGEHNNEETNKE